MALQPHTQPALQEAKIQLTIQALNLGQLHSKRRAAALYNIPLATLNQRHTGRVLRRKIRANLTKLTTNEEQVVIDHILNLDLRGFSPQYITV